MVETIKRPEENLLTRLRAVVVTLGIFCLSAGSSLNGQSSSTCKSLGIALNAPTSQTLKRDGDILARRIEEHSGVRPVVGGAEACEIELGLHKGIGTEGFRIEHVSSGKVRITGNDARGLLYGIGKFLRTNTYGAGSVTIGSWQGVSVPDKPFREMYFATHFGNFYEVAPIERINRYVEDLALWGYNGIDVWFDMHQYKGIQDPAAQAMIKRLKAIMASARTLGLSPGLTLLANEAYANSPLDLRADWTAGHDGYFKEPRGHYHVELCPNKPGAKELMLKWREEIFREFHDSGVDHFIIWPYDQGGCTNKECAPWGANGFLTMAQPIAEMARRDFPGSRIVLSTWYFDHFTSGEWEGLEARFAENRPLWVDYIMADETGGLQRYSGNPPKHAVPGGFPLLSFPEISMWGATPWGGFGANPLPVHHQAVWNLGKDSTVGGFPYSEGIFDDLNKVLYGQFYWNRKTSADSTVDEYIAYEFSPEIVRPMRKAIQILEEDYPRRSENVKVKGARVRFVLDRSGRAREAFDLFRESESHLSPQVRNSWRWRILYLRALIDSELAQNDFQVSDRCEKAFEELTRIYHAQAADFVVSPPDEESIERGRDAAQSSTK